MVDVWWHKLFIAFGPLVGDILDENVLGPLDLVKAHLDKNTLHQFRVPCYYLSNFYC